jgi:transposase
MSSMCPAARPTSPTRAGSRSCASAGCCACSFVPPRDIHGLRALTRYRTRLVPTRAQETQRVEKVLEDAVVKLGAVASKTLTKSGRAMIEALIAGERDPAVLAEMAKTRMRPKIPQLVRALDGRFSADHAAQLRGLPTTSIGLTPPSAP